MPKELRRHRNLIALSVAGVIFVVCLSCFGLPQRPAKKARTARSGIVDRGLVVSVKASHTLVKLPPPTPDLSPLNCEPTETKVKLSAASTSPRNSVAQFTWKVPVGRLIGKGGAVIWDLSGVKEGTYTATVEVSDRYKNAGDGSVAVTVVECPWIRYDPPPCPVVLVSCPAHVEAKEATTFLATVAGGDPEAKLTYKWSLSAGKIVSGQETSKLTVDVSDVSNGSVTATVSIGGVNPNCVTLASCTILEVK